MSMKPWYLIINGNAAIVACEPEEFLADVLRRIGFTSVKIGCGAGQCGACNIILNGKLIRSCTRKMKSVPENSRIETLEGIGTKDHPHPLQLAWVKYNALQCGFCSPGFIVSAKALLDQNPDPTREEVRSWFQKNRNACRCTGYKTIVDAVMEAAAVMRGEKPRETLLFDYGENRRLYGTDCPRPGALDRVTGRCDYGDDLNQKLPAGTLYLAPVFADVNHGEILGLNIQEAEAMPGVRCVLTWKDVKGDNRIHMPVGRKRSKATGTEQPILAEDKVFRLGDVVALVAASSHREAREAAAKVKVNVKPLPEYMTLLEAIDKDSEEIHPGVPNIFLEQPHVFGEDTAPAIREAQTVAEASYYTQRQPHLVIEPESAFAYLQDDGVLTIHYKFQTLYNVKGQLSAGIGHPADKIRIISNPAGGSFGYTMSPSTAGLVAVAALATRRPCALTMNYEEYQKFTGKRAPSFSNVRMAADKNGRITAMEYELAFDVGAHPQFIGALSDKGPSFMGMPYRIPRVRGLTKLVFTNHNYNITYRSYGVVSTSTATEMIVDELAHAAGIDPLEFRYQNVLRQGEICTEGHPLESYRMPDLIDRMRPQYREALAWAKEKSTERFRYGVGVACSVYKAGGGVNDKCEIALELNRDGTVTIFSTWADLGQGADVGVLVHAQEALAPMGMEASRIRMVLDDTGLCPNSGSTAGSRSHYMNGQAIVIAANKLMDAMRKEDGTFRSYEEMTAEGIPTKYSGFFTVAGYEGMRGTDPNTGLGHTASANAYTLMMAVVRVDTTTGEIKVIRFVSDSDIGKVGSVQAVQGQGYSGISHGIGLALSEQYEDVRRHTNLIASGFPYIEEIPDDMEVRWLDEPRKDGPQGSIGCSEAFQSSPHVAVNNAVFQACGIRLREFPMTPDKVKAALAAKGLSPAPQKRYDLGGNLMDRLAEMAENPV